MENGVVFVRFEKFLRFKRTLPRTSLADDRTGHDDLDGTSSHFRRKSGEFSYLFFPYISKSLQKVPVYRCRCMPGVVTTAAVDGRADGEKKKTKRVAYGGVPGSRPSRATRRDRTIIIGGLAIHAAGRSAREAVTPRGRGFGGRPAGGERGRKGKARSPRA